MLRADPKEEFSVYFPLWGGGSDYSSDEKVSFLWEAATKQAPGNPQANGSALTNPESLGMGALLSRTTLGLVPCCSSLRALRSTTSTQPAAPIYFRAFFLL